MKFLIIVTLFIVSPLTWGQVVMKEDCSDLGTLYRKSELRLDIHEEKANKATEFFNRTASAEGKKAKSRKLSARETLNSAWDDYTNLSGGNTLSIWMPNEQKKLSGKQKKALRDYQNAYANYEKAYRADQKANADNRKASDEVDFSVKAVEMSRHQMKSVLDRASENGCKIENFPPKSAVKLNNCEVASYDYDMANMVYDQSVADVKNTKKAYEDKCQRNIREYDQFRESDKDFEGSVQ